MNCAKCGNHLSSPTCPACKHNNLEHLIATRQIFLYGVTGRAGAGKSTFAKFFRDLTKEGAIIPFAAKVKDFATDMGWNGEKDEKGRRLLQLIGTECGRQCIDPDIWIMHWHRTISNLPIDTLPMFIITDDVRFNNEAEAIRALGGKVIKLTGRHSGLSTEHASEHGIDHELVDIRIDNANSILELRKEAAKYANPA